MKISEILKLTFEKNLATIAKEHLSIGEKTARQALKNAGCYTQNGKKGWYFDGGEEVLQMDIYDFVEDKNKVKKGSKANKKATKPVIKKNSKRASFDLDADLLKQLKIKAVIEEKNIYELVEQAIKEFLEKG